MKSITISELDAKLLMQPDESVALQDPQGNVIRVLAPLFSKEEIETALARKKDPGRRIPSREVLARLAAMETE